jgi:hypothetical protein
MSDVEIYSMVRSEILINHVLMHVITLLVVILLLGGTWLNEDRKSIISVILPLLTLAWAAAIVRFDFFIHRQAAYLRVVEAHMRESGAAVPLWETWKSSLRSTGLIVPVTDFIAFLVVIVPTVYLLFGPAQEFFALKGWSGSKAYAWGVIITVVLLLGCLPFVPKIAQQ